MSYIATVQNAVDQAFNAIGDLAGDFTLKRSTNVFNPATSDYTSTSTTFVGKGVFDGDKSKFLPTTELAHGTTRVWLKITEPPLLTDVLVMPSGTERSIIEVKPIQANSTVFLYEVIVGA